MSGSFVDTKYKEFLQFSKKSNTAEVDTSQHAPTRPPEVVIASPAQPNELSIPKKIAPRQQSKPIPIPQPKPEPDDPFIKNIVNEYRRNPDKINTAHTKKPIQSSIFGKKQ